MSEFVIAFVAFFAGCCWERFIHGKPEQRRAVKETEGR
jgi:hypothetical protein